ncbi:MAG: hypothetical protein ACK56I_11175, partial [bacterium]
GDIGHNLLPVRPLDGDHLCQVEHVLNAHRLRRLKGNGEVSPFLAGLERGVGNLVRNIGVEEGAERHAVVPRAAEVGYVHIHVAGRLGLAPFEESVALGAAVFDEGGERVTAAADAAAAAQHGGV